MFMENLNIFLITIIEGKKKVILRPMINIKKDGEKL